MIDFNLLQEISNHHGDSFYTFNSEQLKQNIHSFRDSFTKHYPKIEVAYSYKTNYIPSILKLMDAENISPEVVSEMEYDLAVAIGVDTQRIIFNGPVKNYSSLSKAILNQSRINIDSLDELHLILKVLLEIDITSLEIGIRCNFGTYGDFVSRFGIDVNSEEFLRCVQIIRDSKVLKLAGLHCHLPDRDLKSVAWRTSKLLEVSVSTFDEAPKYLDFGGGFFGSNFPIPREDIVSFEEYAKLVTNLVKSAYPSPQNQPWIILEPGTALVANTMNYWTRVVAVKKINSKFIAVVDGSIHELSPNGRQERNPNYHMSMNSVTETSFQPWQIVGYTCIEDDFLSKNYLSEIRKGDFFGYTHVGSYNIVMKPPFIRPASAVLELDQYGEILNVIREKQTIEGIFLGFCNGD